VRALGAEVQLGAVVVGAYGREGVRTVRVVDVNGRARRDLEADCLLISGGYSPLTTLASQLGARLTWQEAIAAFSPDLAPAIGRVAGAARGVAGLAAAARDGEHAACAIAAELGRAVSAADLAGICRSTRTLRRSPRCGRCAAGARRLSICRTM